MSERLSRITSGKVEPKPKGRFGVWISGRARRREYWAWTAPWFVIVVMASVIAPTLGIVLSLPILLIWIRRLHDLGWTGWMAPVLNMGVMVIGYAERLLLSGLGTNGLVQIIASFGVLIGLGVLSGERKRNEYGAPPGQPTEPDRAETLS